MKFERMKLPVIIGMDSIEQYNPNTTVYLSSIRNGIPCLIINGQICDTNGAPFKNASFQEQFKDISERAEGCKTIIFGRVIDTSMQFKNCGMYDLGNLQRINYNSKVFEGYKDSIKIEIEDIYCHTAPLMDFKTRHAFATNMVLSIKAVTGKVNTEIQNYISLSDYKKKDADLFILSAARRNEIVLFRAIDSVYKQGEATLSESRSFYLNPFEELDGDIKSIEFEAKKPIEIEEEESHLTAVVVSYGDVDNISINYVNQKPETRRLLYNLISSKKMNSIKFEAVIYKDELKFARTL